MKGTFVTYKQIDKKKERNRHIDQAIMAAHGTRANKLPEQTALLSGYESSEAGSSPDVVAVGDAVVSEPQTTPDGSHDGPNHPVSFARGISIGFNLFLLIFCHCTLHKTSIFSYTLPQNDFDIYIFPITNINKTSPATNMSGLAMIQGSLAQDLHSPSQAMWFTTSYLIAVSSLIPLVGRLANIFSPRSVILPSAALFSLGSLAASQARSFAGFVAGRVVMGCGGAGVVVMAVVFVIELTGKRRRGVMIGFVNAAFTMGVSVGAAVYGVLQPVVGWVSLYSPGP
jgi:hypothetical protein